MEECLQLEVAGRAIGLSNATFMFMRFMNQVLKQFIGRCVVDFDDICVYGSSIEAHIQHLRKIIEILQKEKLDVKFKSAVLLQRDLWYSWVILIKQPKPLFFRLGSSDL